MKNYYFILIVLFSLIPLTPSQATSGACSWHGGVNCSAGPDFDGSVICNDGWRNSSVLFSETTECSQPTSDACSYLNPLNDLKIQAQYGVGCSSETDYQSKLEYKKRTYNNQVAQSVEFFLPTPPPFDPATDPDLISCRGEIDSFKQAQQQYNQCLSRVSHNIQAQADEDRILALNRVCQNSVTDSVYDQNTHKCVCNTGEWNVSGACVSAAFQCLATFGTNSSPNGDTCECKTGYLVGSSEKCEPATTVCQQRMDNAKAVYENGKCIVKSIRMISAAAKNWSDNNGKCVDATFLSQAEIQKCIDYQLYRDSYDWETYASPVSIPTTTPTPTPTPIPQTPPARVLFIPKNYMKSFGTDKYDRMLNNPKLSNATTTTKALSPSGATSTKPTISFLSKVGGFIANFFKGWFLSKQ